MAFKDYFTVWGPGQVQNSTQRGSICGLHDLRMELYVSLLISNLRAQRPIPVHAHVLCYLTSSKEILHQRSIHARLCHPRRQKIQVDPVYCSSLIVKLEMPLVPVMGSLRSS